jgi:hypothetical protein
VVLTPARIAKLAGRFGRLRVIKGVHQGQVRRSPPLDAATQIDASWVEAVALHVVALIRDDSALNHRRLVDAATLAAELGVDRSWVYAHRDELGAVRLGAGSKPRLRFDPEAAREVLAGHGARDLREPKSSVPAGSSRRGRRRRTGSTSELLPIRGSAITLDGDEGQP